MTTGAGADFQHLFIPAKLQSLALEGHRKRLRNGLAVADRERTVVVSVLHQVRRHELFARHLAHGGQDAGIYGAAGLYLPIDHVPTGLGQGGRGVLGGSIG